MMTVAAVDVESPVLRGHVRDLDSNTPSLSFSHKIVPRIPSIGEEDSPAVRHHCPCDSEFSTRTLDLLAHAMEPTVRIERTAYRLQGGCSAT